MNWFCPVSFNGFYFPMSSLAPWQAHLVERTWSLETASPWFLVSLLIFWVLSLINQMTLSKFFRPSEPVSSFQWFLPSDLLMSLEEMWYIYHPAPPFTSLIAGCQRDMASQAISLLFFFIYSSQGPRRGQQDDAGLPILCGSSRAVEGQRGIMKLTEKLSNLNNSDLSQLPSPQRSLHRPSDQK